MKGPECVVIFASIYLLLCCIWQKTSSTQLRACLLGQLCTRADARPGDPIQQPALLALARARACEPRSNEDRGATAALGH